MILSLFGYDDSGERLWRSGTNGYTIWIGGIYEINNGKVLCHVVADGQLIATFEPQCNAGLSKVFGEQNWYVASNTIQSVLDWPFQNGRGNWTVFGGTWVGILGLCMMAGRGTRLKRYEMRRALSPSFLWRPAVTFIVISTFLGASVGDVEAAIYNPVFYYYHTDHLGSSNVLTDRSGNVVQHYEYATFGQTSYQNNTSAFPISNRYTGQIADDETGLLYYGGRYYDPQLGRFIQPDPSVPDPTDSQSLNRYSYCRNNPLNEVDPSGYQDDDGGGGDDYGGGDYGGGDYGGGDNGGNDYVPPAIFSYSYYNYGPNYSLYVVVGYGFSGFMPPIDYGSINSGFDNAYSPGDFPQVSFDNFGIPNVAPPQQPGGESGWLKATNAVLTVASLAPGPVGAIASAAQAGLDLVQGHYIEAGIAVGGIALSFIGLGVAAKAVELARGGRIAKNAEALAVDVGKLTKSVGELRAAGLKDAHHVIQDASVRDLVGYDTKLAPWCSIARPFDSNWNSSLHCDTDSTSGWWRDSWCRMRIGYKALRQAGYSEPEARQIITESEAYFKSIGATKSTPTSIPGNRD